MSKLQVVEKILDNADYSSAFDLNGFIHSRLNHNVFVSGISGSGKRKERKEYKKGMKDLKKDHAIKSISVKFRDGKEKMIKIMERGKK